MTLHDTLYKRLFSHAPMMRSLLQGFAPEGWAERLDFGTLEKVPGSFITADRRARHGDLVWRIRTRSGWLSVYLLLEFQSRVDPHMALRMMTYLGLLYEDLLLQRAAGPGARLPPVLPLVLYNGAARWRAPQNVGRLVAPPPGRLGQYRPRLAYLLLDQVRLVQSGLLPPRNLAAAFFRLESGRTLDDARTALQTLQQCTTAPEFADLRSDLVRWLSEDRLLPDLPDMISRPHDIQEIQAMFRKIIADMLRASAQEGRHALLERQLTHRFGPLPPAMHDRLRTASPTQLDHWAIALLDAPSAEAVFTQSSA